MAIDRVSNFILSGIDSRFNTPDIENYNGRRYGDESVELLIERDFSKDVIEIPAFCYQESIYLMENTLNHNKADGSNYPDKYVYTILRERMGYERKQVNTILKDFISRMYSSKMVQISNKGNIYYGYPGLITDCNFNPLVYFKVRAEKVKNDDLVRTDSSTCEIRITDYICYVSPNALINQDGIVEKVIYKKIIPFCSNYVLHNNSNNLRFRNYHFVKYDWEGKHIQVVIKDDIECFIKPNIPKIEDFESCEIIKNLLLDNIECIT